MTVNLNQIREHLRNTDIGRRIDFYYAEELPHWEDVSEGKMAWLDAAVLYCDISGYTSLTNDNRSETVARILIGFHSSMVRITNQCRGRVLSFAGDRVMSVFCTTDIESTINYAMQCALAMQSIVRYILPEEFEERNFKEGLSCTIGVDYGRVLMGRFGAGKTTDIVLVGDAANLAAKYQANTNPDETFVSTTVYNNFPDWLANTYWYFSGFNLPDIGYISGYKSKVYYTLN